MKITKRQLKQIIKEERAAILNEGLNGREEMILDTLMEALIEAGQLRGPDRDGAVRYLEHLVRRYYGVNPKRIRYSGR